MTGEAGKDRGIAAAQGDVPHRILCADSISLFAFCFIFFLSPTCAATAGRPQDDVATFRTDVRLVVLHVSVVDKNGKLLTNIPQSAFKVLENGVEQPIKLFRREDVPVSMGIIIDNSGSMRDKRAKVAAASMDLVKASNPQDEVFIVNFNDDAYLDQSVHQRHQEAGRGARKDRLQGRNRHARRHQHVDRLRKGQGQEG